MAQKMIDMETDETFKSLANDILNNNSRAVENAKSWLNCLLDEHGYEPAKWPFSLKEKESSSKSDKSD